MDDTFDYRDLLLEAYADFQEIVTELLQELQMPQMLEALRVRWMTMPDEAKEQVKELYPDMYDEIMEMIGQQKGGSYANSRSTPMVPTTETTQEPT